MNVPGLLYLSRDDRAFLAVRPGPDMLWTDVTALGAGLAWFSRREKNFFEFEVFRKGHGGKRMLLGRGELTNG